MESKNINMRFVSYGLWIFRLYMLIGGMPQAIETYLEHNNLQVVDEVKREIVELYE